MKKYYKKTGKCIDCGTIVKKTSIRCKKCYGNVLSVRMRGHEVSKETREKISKANIGRKHTKEHKKNISESAKKAGCGKWMKGRKLSEETKNKLRGRKPWNYKGKTKKKIGYIFIHSPNHPHRNKDNNVFEHRLIVEDKIGRYLLSSEIVHHKNGIKDDNRISNLELFNNAKDHLKSHKINKWSRKFNKCIICENTKYKHCGNGICKNCNRKIRYHKKKEIKL